MPERILRINQLIKKELGQIILKEVEFPLNVLVTLTRVETLPNLTETKVFISTMPEKESLAVLKILNRMVYYLQQIMNKRLRMRPTPKIIFIEEKETIEAGKIEYILEGLKEEKK